MNGLETIEIVASFDDNYAQHAAVMMTSVLKHTSRQVAFHFLISDLQADNATRLKQLAGKHGAAVSFHSVDEHAFGGVILEPLSVQAYFRLLIPVLFKDKSRLLYLDVDIVLKDDIGELFDLELGDATIAAVADPGVTPDFVSRISHDGLRYFNSGVMLIAADRMSPAQSAQWLDFAKSEHSRITFHDQCVLNHFVGFRKISPRFNLMSQFLLPYAELKNYEYSLQDVEAARASPVVVHYNAYFGKPWEARCRHPFKADYLRYLLLTPWRWKIFRILLSQTTFRIRNRLNATLARIN